VSVLESPPPAFTADDVARIARERFGIDGDVENLGSERDQTFGVGDAVV
jgi:Ser/Thr protein kinase RdoA (MazF antagonist)